MPKRTLKVVLRSEKVFEILIALAGGQTATAEVQILGENTWVVSLPVREEDGMTTTEVVEYSKPEIDEILFQYAKDNNSIDVTGGGTTYEYDFGEAAQLKSVTLEFQGTKR